MTTRNNLTYEKLVELYVRKNFSLSKIGELYRISKQRVHQLKKEYEETYGEIKRHLSIDAFSLKHYLDKGWSAKEIASHYEMHPAKISRLIRKYKEDYDSGHSTIKIKKLKAEDIISELELYNLYIRKLYTDKEIAEKFNVSTSTINYLRIKYKIQTNNNKSARKLPNILTPEVFEELYIKQGYTLNDLSIKFKCSTATLIQLKKIQFKNGG